MRTHCHHPPAGHWREPRLDHPVVLAHARAPLTSSPEGRAAYIQADLRDPADILDDPQTREVLDFTRPVALVMAS
jgi:hypothetical protein